MSSEAWVSIVLGLIGLGIMAGQDFDPNRWSVGFFIAAGVAVVAAVFRKKTEPVEDLSRKLDALSEEEELPPPPTKPGQ